MNAVVFLWLLAAALAAEPAASTNAPRRSWDLPSPFAKGPLVSVDLGSRRLVIETRAGPQPFLYTERTYIIRAGEKVTPDKLKAGDIVAIRYLVPTNGVPVIQRLKAYPPAPAAPVPAPPEALPLPPEVAPKSPGTKAGEEKTE